MSPSVYVISLNFTGDYPGWTSVATQMKDLIGALTEAKLDFKITRLGLRHIDFFNGDFAPNLRLSVNIDGKEIHPPSMACVMILKHAQFGCRVQVHTHARLKDKPEGCVLDSDVSTEMPEFSSLGDSLFWYEEAHKLQKRIFCKRDN